MNLVKIGIADDHQLFSEGLEFILNKEGFEVIFNVTDGLKLLEAVNLHPVDILLIDLKMPIIGGIEATKKIKEDFPHIKIIILTMHDEEPIILSAMNNGANAYLLKNSPSQDVINAIQSVIANDYYFTDFINKVMLKGVRNEIKAASTFKNNSCLTAREQEVLKLICLEYTTLEIAAKLFISDRTVESHRKKLLEKLNAKNTAGLVIKAFKLNMINI